MGAENSKPAKSKGSVKSKSVIVDDDDDTPAPVKPSRRLSKQSLNSAQGDFPNVPKSVCY
jgi:hypothetical protein